MFALFLWQNRLNFFLCHADSSSFPAAESTKHLGRKASMVFASILYLISAPGVAFARESYLSTPHGEVN